MRVKPYELFVSIEVEDTGIGIAEDEYAKVFGRFYRSISVSDEQGVGIGLYLAREILKQESGYIKLASEMGMVRFFPCICLWIEMILSTKTPTEVEPDVGCNSYQTVIFYFSLKDCGKNAMR